MIYEKSLEIAAHWSAILTAAVAVLAYGGYRHDRYKRRRRLENYLQTEKLAGHDRGQRTVLHLVAHLGMTEVEIVDVALRSRHIRRVVGKDERGRAETLLFEYKP